MITVYTKNACPRCDATTRSLRRASLTFNEVSLENRPDLIEDFRARGFTSAPIVDAGEAGTWSGFRPDRLKALVQVEIDHDRANNVPVRSRGARPDGLSLHSA